MYTIDGTSSEKVNGFGVWRVMDDNGNVVCTFYGPMSFLCAVAAAKNFNEDDHKFLHAQDYFLTHTYKAK